VVAYRWRSSLDGDLSTKAGFQTSSLSPGVHTVYFKVQDNNGAWSEEAVWSNITVLAGGLPVIAYFSANPPVIGAGGWTTLSWSVSNATQIMVMPGIGQVAASGSTNVSPSTTTSYTLTATNPSGYHQMTMTVTVVSTDYTLILEPRRGESGYVRSDGQVVPGILYVGDDENNRPLQSFLSFDISGIPVGATISQVVVDFSDYDRIFGDPFGSLGCLKAYLHDYGVLDDGDYFTGAQTESLMSFCSVADLSAHSNISMRNALQSRMGGYSVQMGLQFNDIIADSDGNSDLVSWTPSHWPRLIVTYTVATK